MDSKIGFEICVIVVEAIRGRCASFTVLTATVCEIFGGQTNYSIRRPIIDFNTIAGIGLWFWPFKCESGSELIRTD